MASAFYINLAKDVARKELMESEFERTDLQVCRFEAWHPGTLQHRYTCTEKAKHSSSEEEISCFSSHIDVFRLAKQNNPCTEGYVLIFEDDQVLKSKSIEKLDEVISTAPKDWEMLQLHHLRLDCRRKPPDYGRIINGNWVEWHKGYYSSAFYAVKNNVLPRLVQEFYDCSTNRFNFSSIDTGIQIDNVIYGRCKTYTSIHNFSSTNLHFKSNIQPTRQDALIKDFETKSEGLHKCP